MTDPERAATKLAHVLASGPVDAGTETLAFVVFVDESMPMTRRLPYAGPVVMESTDIEVGASIMSIHCDLCQMHYGGVSPYRWWSGDSIRPRCGLGEA